MPPPVRVLVVHESYAYRGGEDLAVEADEACLKAKGHQVLRWSVNNKQIEEWSIARRGRLLWQTTWSSASYRMLISLLRDNTPDVVHFHNTLPIISPAAIRAAHDAGLAVVMTLHNYRLICPAGGFLRGGRVCEDCLTHSLVRGIIHGCYRGSRLQTAAVAAMLAYHRRAGTWEECVDAYVAPTAFLRAKMIEGGLPAEKVHVRPGLVDVAESDQLGHDDYALFVGRLSAEKGIHTLLQAASRLEDGRLKVIGAGPMEQDVRAAARRLGDRLELLGETDHAGAVEAIRRARVLLFPSICYESLGLVLLEALACGVPVVASRLGAMAEAITDGKEGFLVSSGDAEGFAEKLNLLIHDDDLRRRMSLAAKETFRTRYSMDRSYHRLMDIYNLALDSARARHHAA